MWDAPKIRPALCPCRGNVAQPSSCASVRKTWSYMPTATQPHISTEWFCINTLHHFRCTLPQTENVMRLSQTLPPVAFGSPHFQFAFHVDLLQVMFVRSPFHGTTKLKKLQPNSCIGTWFMLNENSRSASQNIPHTGVLISP